MKNLEKNAAEIERGLIAYKIKSIIRNRITRLRMATN